MSSDLFVDDILKEAPSLRGRAKEASNRRKEKKEAVIQSEREEQAEALMAFLRDKGGMSESELHDLTFKHEMMNPEHPYTYVQIEGITIRAKFYFKTAYSHTSDQFKDETTKVMERVIMFEAKLGPLSTGSFRQIKCLEDIGDML